MYAAAAAAATTDVVIMMLGWSNSSHRGQGVVAAEWKIRSAAWLSWPHNNSIRSGVIKCFCGPKRFAKLLNGPRRKRGGRCGKDLDQKDPGRYAPRTWIFKDNKTRQEKLSRWQILSRDRQRREKNPVTIVKWEAKLHIRFKNIPWQLFFKKFALLLQVLQDYDSAGCRIEKIQLKMKVEPIGMDGKEKTALDGGDLGQVHTVHLLKFRKYCF